MRKKKLLMLLAFSLLWGWASAVWSQPVSQVYQQSYDEEAKGNYTEAILILMRIERSEEKSYLFHLRLGWLHYLAKKYPESAIEYQKAVNLNKESIEAKLGFMLPLMAQGRWTDAEKIGKDIFTLDRASYLAISRLAYIYYNLNRYREAESYYRKVLQYYPGDIEMQAGLAWSLLRQDKKADAEKVFNEILRYAPNHITANVGMRMLKEK